ncbi:Receptor-like protein kinase HSL1, partial [Linum perenne]
SEGNKLSGGLPGSLVNLKQLGTLNLHGNLLSGELPEEIGSWKKLNELNLGENQFTGKIPNSIGKLSVLNHPVLVAVESFRFLHHCSNISSFDPNPPNLETTSEKKQQILAVTLIGSHRTPPRFITQASGGDSLNR